MQARKYRATVEYDGTAYCGFQVQPERPSIQSAIEDALRELTGESVRVVGAGRTDAGVHAKGQVVSFETAWKHGADVLQRGLNAKLPLDIAVHDVQYADERFHARFSATGRTYLYTVYRAPVRLPLIGRYAHHVTRQLDSHAMVGATQCLLGTHDLSAFGQPPAGDNTVRTVKVARWWQPAGLPEGDLVVFEIQADAFLRGMVRRIVGTLLRVGAGDLRGEGFEAILSARDIALAAAPVPACGLCLWRVSYPIDADAQPSSDAARARPSDDVLGWGMGFVGPLRPVL